MTETDVFINQMMLVVKFQTFDRRRNYLRRSNIRASMLSISRESKNQGDDQASRRATREVISTKPHNIMSNPTALASRRVVLKASPKNKGFVVDPILEIHKSEQQVHLFVKLCI